MAETENVAKEAPKPAAPAPTAKKEEPIREGPFFLLALVWPVEPLLQPWSCLNRHHAVIVSKCSVFEPPSSFKAGFPDDTVGKVDERWKEKFGAGSFALRKPSIA